MEGPRLPLYLHAAQHTSAALAAQVQEPADLVERTRIPVEKLGGRRLGVWHAISHRLPFTASMAIPRAAAARLAVALGVRVAAVKHAGASGYRPAAAT